MTIPAGHINAQVDVYLQQRSDGIYFSLIGDHTRFPAYELYVNRKILYFFDPVTAGTGPLSLVGLVTQSVMVPWTKLQ